MSDIPDIGVEAEERSNSGRILSFVISILAGCVVFGSIYLVNPLFDVPKEYHIRGLGESNERWSAYLHQQHIADHKNAALFLGLLGTLLAASFALPSNGRWSLLGRLGVCVPIGMVSGAIAGSASCLLHSYLNSLGQLELQHSVAIYATMIGLMGAGIGIGMGISFDSPIDKKAVVERMAIGLISGALAGAAYPIASSLLAPSINIESLLPKSPVSLAIWLGLATGILGISLPVAPRMRNGGAKRIDAAIA